MYPRILLPVLDLFRCIKYNFKLFHKSHPAIVFAYKSYLVVVVVYLFYPIFILCALSYKVNIIKKISAKTVVYYSFSRYFLKPKVIFSLHFGLFIIFMPILFLLLQQSVRQSLPVQLGQVLLP